MIFIILERHRGFPSWLGRGIFWLQKGDRKQYQFLDRILSIFNRFWDAFGSQIGTKNRKKKWYQQMIQK